MTEPAQETRQGLAARLRERRQDPRQRRARRRERLKRNVNAYDAHIQAESSNYQKGGFFTTGKRD